MTVKSSVAEFKQFYNNLAFWPPGSYHDDVIFSVNGIAVDDADFNIENFSDSDAIVVEGGDVYLSNGNGFFRLSDSVENHFKKWKKQQVTVLMVIEVNCDREAEVRASVFAARGTIRQ
jgi:hypothetical protein